VEIIYGRLAVSMGLWGRDWDVVEKYIREQDRYDIIERNKENASYRPRNICTGYTVVTALRACSRARKRR